MVNTPADDLPNFRPGQKLLAVDMQKIVNMVLKRIHGADGLTTRTAGGTVTLVPGRARGRRPASNVVLARLGAEDMADRGHYAWTKDRGEGPQNGTAEEFELTEDLPADLLVTLIKIGGKWVFSGAVTDAIGAGFEVSGSGSSTSMPATLSDTPYFLFGTNLYADGVTVVSSGRAKVVTAGWYTLTMQAKARLAISRGWEFIWRKNDGLPGAATVGPTLQHNNLSTSNVQDLSLGGTGDVLLAAGDEISTRMASNGGILFNIPTKAQWSIKLWKAVTP